MRIGEIIFAGILGVVNLVSLIMNDKSQFRRFLSGIGLFLCGVLIGGDFVMWLIQRGIN